MPVKRTNVAFGSPAPSAHHLRQRKRRKTTNSSSRVPRNLDSDGDDAERAGYETESDYEDEPERTGRGSRASSTSAASSRRRSAPAGGGGRTTRRGSLPQRQSLGNGVAGPSRPRAASARRGGGGKEDDHLPVTQHPAPPAGQQQRRRTSKVLSPLPVNHNVPRATRNGNGKGKERELDDVEETRAPKRPRAPPAPSGQRITRRMSGGMLEPSSSSSARGESSQGRRMSRRGGVEKDDEAMIEEDEDEGMEEEEQVDDEEVEEEEEEPSSFRRGRSASQEDATDAGEAADGEGEEEEWEDEQTPEQEDLDAAVEAKLSDWPDSRLRQLKIAELTELHLTAVPDCSAPSTKDALIRGILDARQSERSDSSLTSVSEGDEADSDNSPAPIISREGSPEPSSHRRSSTTGGRAIRKKVVLNRKSGVRDQPPTPPHTSDEGDNDGEDDDGNATEVEQPRAEQEELAATSTRMTRRASQIEMPPPPLPPPRRGHVRTRSNATNSLSNVAESSSSTAPARQNGSPKARHRVQFDGPPANAAQLLAVAETRPSGSTPVAHRTRGHDRPSSQPGAGLPPPPSKSPRPLRAAKRKAVEKLAKGEKGKGRATSDDEDDEDEEMDFEGEEGEEEEDDVLDLAEDSSESDEFNGEGDSSLEIVDPNRSSSTRTANSAAPRRRKPAAPVGRRRSARTAKQLDTPPSDADEESGGETEREDGQREQDEEEEEAASDEEVETEVTSSHLRRGGRKVGRVVRLSRGEEQDEDEVMQEDVDMDDDEEANGAIDLAHATSKTLLRLKKDELRHLCEEHEVPPPDANATKQKLVDALLEWRDKDLDASSPMSADSSSSSTVSNLSTQTAREETKTQALHAVEHASAKTSIGTPLLMRPEHPVSPEKPRTPEHSKEHEHQEDVNALDLESLQLQDKEIPPEKLTKLESIGSGGFKDVYKGKYRNQTIAICDIRGHLTDMDIKELGLLRDLRNENIVHFIGVSIPKQPSPVPVMIITELCANGDLFDYIRKTTPPPFLSMLEIMLGIARGIDYLHTRKPTIIHRDIKSSNVLVTGKGVAKIADFGLARIKTSTKSMIRSLVGTVNWQAPELWSPHPRYNEKVDVYSVGLVFWEILQWHQAVKRYPFEGQNEHAIYHDVGVKQMRPPTGPLRRQWGGEIVDLITEMWDQEASKRPSMTQVVQYLSGLVATEKARSRQRR